jgi:hypothetical protein
LVAPAVVAVLSLVVADGLISGVLETAPAPCVMLAPDDCAAALVSLPVVDDVLLVVAGLSAVPGVLAELSLDMPLVELPAAPAVFASCAIAAVPSNAATTAKETFSITLTFG